MDVTGSVVAVAPAEAAWFGRRSGAMSDLEAEETMRSHIGVRPALLEDLPVLAGLCPLTSEEPGTSTRSGPHPAEPSRAEMLETALTSPSCRVLLATVAGEPAGLSVLVQAPITPFSQMTAVQVTHMVVTAPMRRRGVGRALMGAAGAYAEEIGADQVVVSVYPLSRELNRFYAQLGFSPMVVRRAAPAGALRRRVAVLDHRAGGFVAASRRRDAAIRSSVRPTRARKAVASAVADYAGEP